MQIYKDSIEKPSDEDIKSPIEMAIRFLNEFDKEKEGASLIVAVGERGFQQLIALGYTFDCVANALSATVLLCKNGNISFDEAVGFMKIFFDNLDEKKSAH